MEIAGSGDVADRLSRLAGGHVIAVRLTRRRAGRRIKKRKWRTGKSSARGEPECFGRSGGQESRVLVSKPIQDMGAEFAGEGAEFGGLGLADGACGVVFGGVALGAAGVEVVGIVGELGAED